MMGSKLGVTKIFDRSNVDCLILTEQKRKFIPLDLFIITVPGVMTETLFLGRSICLSRMDS